VRPLSLTEQKSRYIQRIEVNYFSRDCAKAVFLSRVFSNVLFRVLVYRIVFGTIRLPRQGMAFTRSNPGVFAEWFVTVRTWFFSEHHIECVPGRAEITRGLFQIQIRATQTTGNNINLF